MKKKKKFLHTRKPSRSLLELERSLMRALARFLLGLGDLRGIPETRC